MTFGNPTAELAYHAMLSFVPGYGAYYGLALLQASGSEGRGLQGAFEDGLGQICGVLVLSTVAMSIVLYLIERSKFWAVERVEGKSTDTGTFDPSSKGIVARDITKFYNVNGAEVR